MILCFWNFYFLIIPLTFVNDLERFGIQPSIGQLTHRKLPSVKTGKSQQRDSLLYPASSPDGKDHGLLAILL